MAGRKKYRRERRTRKPQPRIRWTRGQQDRLADAIQDYNEMVDRMEETGLYERTGEYGTYHSIPKKLDYEYEKSRIGSRAELNEFTEMVKDLAQSSPEAVKNVQGANVNEDYYQRIQPYLDKYRAKRWNARENEAEARGFKTWDEMPPELQRTLQAQNPKLQDASRAGAQDVQLGAITDRKWYGDVARFESYIKALNDNGYSADTVDYITDIVEQFMEQGNAGEFTDMLERYKNDPRIQHAYLYNSDNPNKRSPYIMGMATREASLIKFWGERAQEYGILGGEQE